MANKITETVGDFAQGFMGGNYRDNPSKKAGRITRKSLRKISNAVLFFAKRNPLVTAAVVTGGIIGKGMLKDKSEDTEDTKDMPDYINAKGSDYKKQYKQYWSETLGHDGAPKISDFENLGYGYDPETEFSQALRLYMDSKPL